MKRININHQIDTIISIYNNFPIDIEWLLVNRLQKDTAEDTYDNLNQAIKQVKRNKGAAGVDGMTVDEIGFYMLKNKNDIISQIRQRKYRPQPVLRVEILQSKTE